MNIVALDKFVKAFDFLEENADSLVSVPYVSERLRHLIRKTCLTNVRDDDFTRVPLDRVESAIVQKHLTEKFITGFSERLRHLKVETQESLPSAEIVAHLREIGLASLEVSNANPSAWTPFWKGNERLRTLRLNSHSSKVVRLESLPRTLEHLHLPYLDLDAECLDACRESLTTLETDGIAAFDQLDLPKLRTLRIGECETLPLSLPNLETFAYDGQTPPTNLLEFLDEHRLHLRELNVLSLTESDLEGLRMDGFPVLKRLSIGVLKPEMPTSLECLTVDTEDHRALHDYLKKTTGLKSLSVHSEGKVSFDEDTVLPSLERLTLKGKRMPTFLNLRDFANLKTLTIRIHGTVWTETVIRFPHAVMDTLYVQSLAGLFVEPAFHPNVRELYLKSGNVNDSFLISTLPNLRILRLFSVNNERTEQILNILRANRNNVIFAVYVPATHTKWENKFRKACPKLKIFEENEHLEHDF